MKARLALATLLVLLLGFAGSAQAFVFNASERVFEHPFGSLFDTRLHTIDPSSTHSVAFESALAEGYRALSDELGDEWIDDNNWNFADAEHFKHKARTAIRGSNVSPDHPFDRELTDEQTAMFRDEFDRIHRAYARGARYEAPGDAASAQVSYDCWIEATEEGDSVDAAACEEAYRAAIAAAEAAATYTLTEFTPYQQATAVEADVEHAQAFLVFFDFDKSGLRSESLRAIEEVLAASADLSDLTVRIIAHTDTSGTGDYNQALSERRANSVVGALIEGGLDRNRIISEAVGQTQPLVDTGDGVREPANRVAEIDLL